MMQLIDVRTVLRQAVSCDLYSNLVTRPTGAAVRTQIESLLRPERGRSLTVIDFTHVRMIDFSCADEVVAKLLLAYCHDGAPAEAYFVFRGVAEDHWDAIETVLERHGLALLTEDGGGLELRGVLDVDERRAWDVLHQLGCGSASAVAAAIGSDITRAGEVLETLSRRRLVMRSEEGYCAVGAANGRLTS
jgi:hypothetical protein